MSIRCSAFCASGCRGWRSERLLLLLLLLSACLLEAATVEQNAGDPCECNCPQPPKLNLTEKPAAVNCCTNESRFRYKCVVNYVRKAGTSNLAKCTVADRIQKWSTPTLECIPDPRIVITNKPPDVNPTPHTPESTANRGIHQPTLPTSIRWDGAPVGPTTMLTHADPVLTTSPAPPTTTSTPIPTTTTTTSSTTTSTPTTTSSTTTSTPTTSTSTPTTTTSPLQEVPSSTPVSPEPLAPGSPLGFSGAGVPTGLGLAALLLISAILGLFFCRWRWKRRANRPTGSAEPTSPEAMPLKPTVLPPPSASASAEPPS